MELDEQVVEIQIGSAKAESFVDSRTGIEQQQGDRVNPMLPSRLRLELHQLLYLLGSKRGENFHFFFQPWDVDQLRRVSLRVHFCRSSLGRTRGTLADTTTLLSA